MSTETILTIRDWGAQDGHLNFHTTPELMDQFSIALHPQRPYGLLGMATSSFTQFLEL